MVQFMRGSVCVWGGGGSHSSSKRNFAISQQHNGMCMYFASRCLARFLTFFFFFFFLLYISSNGNICDDVINIF